MHVTIKYGKERDDQVVRIRKIANNFIMIIWMAGVSSILLFFAWFLFFTDNSRQSVNNGFETIIGSAQQANGSVFTDKTTLVNIGLRMQAIPEDTDLKSNGSISINKINYDHKLNRIKKPIIPEFAVKAVPK
jgi:hypothetical protein